MKPSSLFWSCVAMLATAYTGRASADWQTTVNNALAAWNADYGTNVQALSWTDNGIIATEAERQAAVQAMTDPHQAWMPSGDAGAPAAMTALLVSDDPSIPAADLQTWADYVNGLVQIGDRRLTVNWNKIGYGNFTTLCVVDPNTVVYDDMISNASGGGAPGPGPGNHVEVKRCLDHRLWWLWERIASSDPADWTRGSITADNNPTCSSAGSVITCDVDCQGQMTAGQAECKCRSTKVAGAECCQMEYNWAWACGFKKIKVAADGYTLELEGIIGSSGSGNGSCTECCPGSTPIHTGSWGMLKTIYR